MLTCRSIIFGTRKPSDYSQLVLFASICVLILMAFLVLIALPGLPTTNQTLSLSLRQSLKSAFPGLAPQLEGNASFIPETLEQNGQTIKGIGARFKARTSKISTKSPTSKLSLSEQIAATQNNSLLNSIPAEPPKGLSLFYPENYNGIFRVGLENFQVEIKPLNGQSAPGKIEDATMVYRGAYPQTDVLQLVSDYQTSKEVLLLHDSSAPTSFNYSLSVPEGTKVQLEQSGTVKVTGPQGEELKIEAPWLVDSNGQHYNDPGVIKWELSQPGQTGQWLLEMKINPAGLTYPLAIDPSWRTGSSLVTARYGQTATLLQNGKILVVGGFNNNTPLTSAELYDPVTNSWSTTGNMTNARGYHTATLLTSGKVLVAGGNDNDPITSYLDSAELYDPISGLWTGTGKMVTARDTHTATLLADGRVLLAGGSNNDASILTNTEIFNPASNNWTAAASMGSPRSGHSATLLTNGKVVVAGGLIISSAELYDPITGLWSATGNLLAHHQYHSATLLVNGKVLLVGGYNENNALANSELYDPITGVWAATGNLATARYRHTATLLPNGKVQVVGGFNSIAIASTELYDPVTGVWSSTGNLATTRYRHTSILLPNGKIQIAGGLNTNSLASTELYDPTSGSWNNTGNMTTARAQHTTTLLTNGKVLAIGGDNSPSATPGDLYNPATGIWTSTGGLNDDRAGHTATLLPDGKVLVAGGNYDSYLTNSVECTRKVVIRATRV